MQLSRQALSNARNTLKQLESFSLRIIEALGRKKEISELVENVKTVFASLNR
ncbi:conserved hypothetical protein (plasmid) [Borreliella spielmanii A14S]|uniref:BBH37-like helical domain-containing protein n=1 Tax=Borreliella spielmanii A14S TaxID=498742 RepID=B9X9I0_9SPIR|nr:conserved hypothetical protein [Borreliella spielmanii A14S]